MSERHSVKRSAKSRAFGHGGILRRAAPENILVIVIGKQRHIPADTHLHITTVPLIFNNNPEVISLCRCRHFPQ